MKRSNSDTIHPDRNTKQRKPDQGSENDESNCDSEFEAPAKRLSVETKSNVSLPEEISTSNQMDFLTDNHVPNDAENLDVISAVKPPPILMKRSKNFEADLDLINKTFAKIRYKRAGKFTKLLPDTVDMHREIISFLIANNLNYLTPKSRSKSRRIEVTITGIPCDMRTQQVKEALTAKGFDVEKIVQLTEYRNKKPLPLFRAALPNSDRNKNIFNITDLLNLKISVMRIKRSKSLRSTIKCGAEHAHEKIPAKSEAHVPKCINYGENDQVASFRGGKKFHKFSKNNIRKEGTTDANIAQTKSPRNQQIYKELHRMNNNVTQSKTSGKQKNYQELPRLNNNMAQSKTFRNQKKYPELSRMNNNTDESQPATDFQDIIYIMQEFRKLFGKMKYVEIFAQQLRNATSSVEKFELFSAVFLD
ncbi:hypothetical protein AVEN_177059-1 [Araneus ventricosus]|uniref:Pre-C2HC domain-containing protein n=1 Tax=Araneus ventricosus TaxID=182803 RepID=A0A4Y2CRK0_ARAVE|nr:hypothetical protein AVEN_177059-1 [Araneus ventricosus]